MAGGQSIPGGRIDAHQHFWKYDPVKDAWITEQMSVLRKDYLPEHLEPLLQRNGVEGCVTVQADQSELETSFLLDQAERYSFIKGVVGWVDLQAGDVEARLDFFRKFKKLKGFRHILQGEAKRDLMLSPAFKNGIGLLGKNGFTYDILVFPDQLGFARELVQEFPDQKFILDHIGKPYIKFRKTSDWKRDIDSLAALPNVWCKVSGMVTEADWEHWKPADFIPYIDAVVEAFGVNRLLFGSDWPVCLVAGRYEDVVGLAENYFASFSKEEQQRFFGQNAIDFYQL
ncbi:MAG TPA: amidohydrolase family protein [Flavisolibacter sp.]|nr:amidohydrolase family protein [Flavisolibacter sp.]